MAKISKESTCNAGDTGDVGQIPGSGRSSEKEMTSHSGILASRIPWTGSLVGYNP